MNYTGKMRVYFNRHGAAPLVWCVSPLDDDGNPRCEIAVRVIHMTSALASVYRPKSTPDDDDGHPSAWFETFGTLRLHEDGIARIIPEYCGSCDSEKHSFEKCPSKPSNR